MISKTKHMKYDSAKQLKSYYTYYIIFLKDEERQLIR